MLLDAIIDVEEVSFAVQQPPVPTQGSEICRSSRVVTVKGYTVSLAYNDM